MFKPYICDYSDCKKKFTTRFSLRRHLITHDNKRGHECPICFKKFALSQYLKEHAHTHTGLKPFKCPFEGCNRSFRQAGKLSLHKKRHTKKLFAVQKVTTRPIDTNNTPRNMEKNEPKEAGQRSD